MLESGDVLYFDGILLEIGSEDIQVLSSEDKVKSELPIFSRIRNELSKWLSRLSSFTTYYLP